MHIHRTVLVLQLKQIRTEILLQSSSKNSQQFSGFEPPARATAFFVAHTKEVSVC